jgi:multicomponent Na+:H+ antiporter subunit D
MIRPDMVATAPVYLPLLGAALILCGKTFFKGRVVDVIEYIGVFIGLAVPWAAFIHLFGLVFSGGLIEGTIGDWSSIVGITFRFDALAWLVNILGYSVAGAAWIYSIGGGPRGPSFSAVFLIQTASLAATIMTTDLFNLFVCLEVLGIASYILVATSEKPGASLASFSYLMVSATAMVFFLIGLFGFYRMTGSLSYETIANVLSQSGGATSVTGLVSLSLIIAAVAMRVAVMPLYGWLPDAHAMAPHAVSAVLSGVLIKTPLFALSRILVLTDTGMRSAQLLGYAGAFTAIVAVIIALSQKDSKRLLAYHSISQIGYIVSAWGFALSIGVRTPTGTLIMAAAFLHAFYHALFKGLLFLSVGTTADITGNRDVYALRSASSVLRKAGERVPVTLLTFAVGALAISAIPPFNGFASKTAITYSMKGTFHYYLLSAAAVGTVASFIKLSRIFWPTKSNDTQPLQRVGASRMISQILLASLCVAGGIAAPWIYTMVVDMMSVSQETIQAYLPLYSADTLLKTGFTVAAGTILFFAAVSTKGSAVLTRIRERPRSFRGLFISFALGTAGMAAWLTAIYL